MMSEQQQDKPFRMWAMYCPFKKDGFPVLGSFGSQIKPVVILTMDEWLRLCEAVPQLAETQFEVGSYE